MPNDAMNQAAHRRHDLSDHQWSLIENHLPGRKGSRGGQARDKRQFINAVFWILRTGAPWRDLSPDYGGWSNTHRRFIRWRNKGVWTKLMLIPIFEIKNNNIMGKASWDNSRKRL